MIGALLLLILQPGPVSSAWSVTFENSDPCGLKGSSVEFRCSYNYPDGESVTNTTWHRGGLKDKQWKRFKLSELPSYQNRSEYIGDRQHDCSLVIHDLQDNDTGFYYFRFDTESYGWHSKKSVYLSVTEMISARVNPDRVRAGDTVTLECGTSCQHPSVVWFKDGRPVAKPEFQAQTEDSGNYACALKGQESVLSDPVALDVQYPPLNVSVEVSYGNLTVGSSVNLTCNSTANPAADNYTWYKRTASSSSMVQVGSGQVMSFPSVEASHTGLYLCQARNPLGVDNSAEVLLTVDKTDINHLILLVGIGVKVVIVLLLTLAVIWAWRHRCNSTVDKEDNGPEYENISPVYMGQKDRRK
ncbi:B-cell receptor CD22 [Dicentrarchus labrax]|uniref:B-cell receptor CD22 n=1 Tax=Dicentrarchus labrax TaxID=13489 RepID=A0A8C4DDK0_DICLA|nr:B-cell receptor CD22 [Dicentrarchus labrax]XP_051262200.1 B-cell receptor CD22 [Dicentrarchus labrax]